MANCAARCSAAPPAGSTLRRAMGNWCSCTGASGCMKRAGNCSSSSRACSRPGRGRCLGAVPRGIGVVTSPGAAALHDVVTALRRRVPHIPVLLVPAQVQGVAAAPTIIAALAKLYGLAQAAAAPGADTPAIDVILLVRGGGSIEDLWAFND